MRWVMVATFWRQTEPMTHLAEIETCDECQFVSSDYTHDDLLGTLGALAPMWRTTVEGIDEHVLATRPAPEIWSALEYAAHSRDVTRLLDLLVAAMIDQDALVFDGEPLQPDDIGDPVTPRSIGESIDELDEAAQAMAARAQGIPEDIWGHTHTWGSGTHDLAWTVGHVVHDATHHLKDVGRGLHALGVGAPGQRGRLTQINTSDGGVPKTPVSVAEVGRAGLVGDAQNDRLHHGRPLQALCLWSEEVIGSLRSEGHPISAGLAGENLTVSGVDWSTIRPGVRLLVGDVSVEVSAWATPCAKNAAWFADGDFNRMNHERHPGWSRAYAWVLEGGTVRAGDEVVVEP